MYATASVFDVMASDEREARVASRRALALAHTRVENQLGDFLRGAVSSDEFQARLASVRPELEAHVASAVEESNGGDIVAITSSLIDHYQVDRRWQPRGAAFEAPFDDGYGEQCPMCGGPGEYMGTLGHTDHHRCRNCGSDFSTPIGPGPAQLPEDLPSSDSPYPPRMGANNPADQEDTSNKSVTCPECGGSKKTANGQPCPKCAGKGVVRNFGDSVLDHVAADNNTGLSSEGEPKMDKRRWTPQTTRKPVDDSKYYPTRQQDPLEPIIMANRDQEGHELRDIGERSTERIKLPAADGNDSGFSTSTPGGSAPHTKTFPKGDHASPVTRETQ